ncbi:MAG TPA: hypothetical protein VKH37_05840, partial [Ferruginibacter sp.]|nr:hypothetical protein [Ferruginibacter sp.]
MIISLTKRSVLRPLVPFFFCMLFFSCQKELSLENGGGGAVVVTPPDLTTKVTAASVSGFVTDENDAAMLNATVQVGANTVTTDKYGFFEVKNVQVVQTAAVVTVNKTGYFKGIKTWMANQGKSAFFRIKLIPKSIQGTINAATGGTVTLSNGASVTLLANGVVNAATSAAYSGTVNVAVYWFNPTAADLAKTMPGDLRGLSTDGSSLQLLRTFGMMAVELTGSGGELLQVATGKTASLQFPIPSALGADAPATIQLWYFDEAKGLWKEEGTATKSGSNYVASVSHFSFWNCDTPISYVPFSCTVHDPAGNPIHNAIVKITRISNGDYRYGWTDSSGYVSGP